MVVGTKALDASLGEATTGADLGGSSKYSNLVFQHKRQLTLHTYLISIYNRSVIPMFIPFKLQDN